MQLIAATATAAAALSPSSVGPPGNLRPSASAL